MDIPKILENAPPHVKKKWNDTKFFVQTNRRIEYFATKELAWIFIDKIGQDLFYGDDEILVATNSV